MWGTLPACREASNGTLWSEVHGMPDEQQILVDGKLFLGRVEEQRQFRRQLQDLLAPADEEELPCVLLVYGDGGIGKTTLARRFRDIANSSHRIRFSVRNKPVKATEKRPLKGLRARLEPACDESGRRRAGE